MSNLTFTLTSKQANALSELKKDFKAEKDLEFVDMVLVMAEEFKRINSLRKSSLVASQDKDYQNFIKESENWGCNDGVK